MASTEDIRTHKGRIEEFILALGGSGKARVKRSSGSSILFIFPHFAVKVFHKDANISREVSIIEDIQSKFPGSVIRIISFIDDSDIKVIAYETVKTYSKVTKEISGIPAVRKILGDISKSLAAIHASGYYHGDVSFWNIGLNEERRYVPFDFEEARELPAERSSRSYLQYKDVLDFLENMKIVYKGYPESQDIIKHVIEYMETGYVKEKEIEIIFLGKKRKRKKRTYTYSTGDFASFMGWVNSLRKGK